MLKSCECCNTQWNDIAEFMFDSAIKFIGMQIYPDNGKFPCVYYFNHAPCGTSLMLNIQKFSSLIKEPIPDLIMTGEKACPRHCMEVKNFLECENECHNAPFRRFAIKILNNINCG